MSTRVVLAANSAVRKDWIKYVPPVKYGNLVDPKKREAKYAEWEADAHSNALELSPLASVTGDFKMYVFDYTDEGVRTTAEPQELSGTGVSALRGMFGQALKGSYRIMGIGVQTVLKRMYLEGIHADLTDKFTMPQGLWFYPFGGQSDVVFDPIKIIQTGLSTEMPDDLLGSFLGLDLQARHVDAKLEVSLQACKLAGLL